MQRFFIAIVGLALIVMAISGLVTGEIAGWGPLGMGPWLNSTERPIYFWMNVSGYFAFGVYLIYRMLADRE